MDRFRFFLVLFVALIFMPFCAESAKALCGPLILTDWNIGSETVCSDELITIDGGNILINGSGNLTLINSIIEFKTENYEFYKIENNGSLYLREGSIIRKDGQYPYRVYSGTNSRFEIQNSKLEKAGIFEIKTDKVKLYNATITNMYENVSFYSNNNLIIENSSISSPKSIVLNITSCRVSGTTFSGGQLVFVNGQSDIISNNVITLPKGFNVYGSNMNISGNTISSASTAINFYGSDSLIADNKISNSDNGIYSEGNINEIIGNIISVRQTGIHALGDDSITIRSNRIIGGTYGLWFVGEDVDIRNNVIKDSSEGMTLQTSNSKYIINNSLNNMTSYGVKITGGGNNLTSAIVTNTKGVYISGQSNTVRGCQISGNTYGVYSEDSSLSVIMDSIINKSKTYDIFYLHSSPAQIVNSNYTNLSLNWNFDLKVVRGSTVMENASVIIKDVNGVVVFSGKTGPDGRIPQQLISQYENLSGVYKNHNPYTINVTKTNFTANITQLNITNNMDVTINIDTEVNFTMPFTFYMSSPQINKTYFQDDLFNNTYLYLLARSNSNMVSCSYLGTAGAAFSGNLVNATTMPSKDFEKYFDVTAYSQGAYIMTVTCTETTGRTNSTQISFNVYYNYTCINSNDCTPVQVCSTSQHICLPLDCGCGYPENHTCVTYQCCNSTMCDNDQECNITSHTCKNVTCECGYVQDHYCHPYECCNDMQCGPTQICMMNQHICVNRTLYIIMPDEDIFVGKNVSVLVKDQDGEPVSNVRIDVSYKSGRTEEYITDGSGFAYVIIRESGPVQIKAAKERYPAFVILKEAQEGFDWVLTGVVGAVVAGALIVVFFVKGRLFTHTSPVKLEKTVSGDVVMLRVKNRTKEALRNISVIDQVPRGSLTGWNIRPVIRPGSGSVETLIWDILILDPKEEVVIEYRAMQTEQGFSVMVSDKTYYSK